MSKKFVVTLKGEVSVPVAIRVTLEANSEAEADKIAQAIEANPETISEYYGNAAKYEVKSEADVDSLSEILHYYGKEGRYKKLAHEDTEENF